MWVTGKLLIASLCRVSTRRPPPPPPPSFSSSSIAALVCISRGSYLLLLAPFWNPFEMSSPASVSGNSPGDVKCLHIDRGESIIEISCV